MRIVGGQHRGRVLQAGPDQRIRPTSERTREALFNILAHNPAYQSRRGPLPVGRRVVDVFAGSGALGLEALSRGAEHVTFIDHSAESLKIIRLNVVNLKEISRTTLLQRDAQNPGPAPQPCDLAFLDAPYGSGLSAPVLSALAQQGWLADKAVCLVEVGADESISPSKDFTLLDERVYGAAKVYFLTWTRPGPRAVIG